ncbi:MAG: hypothetical protein U0871_14065 [Gemmataceae bacterium]
MARDLTLPTNRRLDPDTVAVLKGLTAGDRIRVTQTVRVGAKTWPAETAGAFRGVNYLATGVTTERVAADDIVVPTVHFTKDNGELASVSLDENTRISRA